MPKAIDSEELTIGATAVALTVPSSTSPVVQVHLTLATAQIRYLYDGTTPTASVGHVMNPGDTLTLIGYENVQNFRAIRTGSTSGVLSVTSEAYPA